jgi:proton-coupled amino acid transporter
MVSIAGISLWSFLLLMQAYMVVPGSFGGKLSGTPVIITKLRSSDMGGALYGKYMRISILVSLTVSQIGFVCGKLAITILFNLS